MSLYLLSEVTNVNAILGFFLLLSVYEKRMNGPVSFVVLV